MLASSFALGSTAIVKTAQRDQPRVVSKEIRLSIGSQVLKGSNDEGVQLVLSRSHVRRLTNVTRGPADVNFTDSNSVHIEGELNNTQTIFVREVRTFGQKDSYVENVTVGERVRRTYQDRNVNGPNSVLVDETFDIPYSYDELDSNENYTKIQRRGLSIFVARWGGLTDIPVNDSEGNEIGRILAFRFHIQIVAFLEESKEFVASYKSTEFGYGNMIPQAVKDRVKNGTSLANRIDRKVIGRERLNSTRPSVEWIDLGYNSTYDLNMSLGVFRFNRHAKLNLIAPAGNRPLTQVNLQSLDTDFESLIDTYAAANEIHELDTMEIDDLDSSLMDEVISAENFDLNAVTNGRQLPFNFLAFLLPFVFAIPILNRKRS